MTRLMGPIAAALMALDDAGLHLLRVAYQASLVDVLAGEADIGCSRRANIVLVWNDVCPD